MATTKEITDIKPLKPEAVIMTEAPIKGNKLVDLFDYYSNELSDEYIDFEKTLVLSCFLETDRVVPLHSKKERNTCWVNHGVVILRSEFVYGDLPENISLGPTTSKSIKVKRNILPDLKYFILKSLTCKLHPILQGGWRVMIDREFEVSEAPSCVPVASWSEVGKFPFPYTLKRCNKIIHVSFWKNPLDMTYATLQMGQMFSTIGKIDKASEGFSNLSAKITETIEPSNIKRVIKEACSEMTNSASVYLEGLLFAVATASGVRYYCKGELFDLKLSVFCSSILLLIEGPNLASSISDMFFENEHTEKSDLPTVQDGEESTLFGEVNRMCTSLHTVFKSYFPIDFKTWKSIYVSISGFDRFKSSLSSLITFIGNLLNSVSEFVIKRRIVPDSILLNGVSCEYILRFCKEIDQIQLDMDVGALELTNTTFTRVIDMRDECERLIINQKTNAVISVLNRRYKDLVVIVDRLRFLQPGIADTRPEPVAILFRGCPGTVKSTWSTSLATALSDSSDNVYSRNFATEYWDGYNNQQVVTLDDFGQIRDVAGTGRSEFLDFICMVNTQPYMLQQAAVENKGRYYFNSEYVLATTNLEEFNLNSIVDSGAVTRRFKFVYSVVPRHELRESEYTKPFYTKPDWSKFDSAGVPGVAQIKPDDFMFVPHDLSTGKDLPQAFTALEVIQRAKEAYLVNKEKHKANLANIAAIVQYTRDDDISMEELYDEDTTASEESLSEKDEGSVYHEPSEEISLKLVYEETPDLVSFSRLKNATRKCIDLYFDQYEKYRNFVVDRATALNILCKKYGKSFIVRMGCGKLSEYEFIKFLKTNFVRLKNVGVKFANDTYSIVRSFLESEDKIFSRAHAWKLLGAGSIGVVVALLSMWESTVATTQSKNVPVKQASKYTSLSEMKKQNTVPASTQAHDVYDTNGQQVYTGIFQRNFYHIMADEDIVGHCLFVIDRYALFQLHWIRKLTKLVNECEDMSKNMYVLTPVGPSGERQGMYLTVGEILGGVVESSELDDSDVSLIKLPHRVRIHKDIRHHFKSRSDLKGHYDAVRRFEFVRKSKNNVPYSVLEITTGPAQRIKNQCFEYEDSNVFFDVHACRMSNHSGLCGTPYVEVNGKLQSAKIIGLHGAGHSDISYAVHVYSEDLINLTKEALIDPLEEAAGVMQSEDPHDNRFYCVGDSEPLGTNTKSDIIKSRFYGKFGDVTTYPSRLVPFKKGGETLDPAVISLSRYNKKQHIVIDPEIVTSLIHSEIDFYRLTNTRTTPRCVYSIEVAVKGLPDDFEFKSITRKTSPGYPYVLDRKGKGRFEYFGSDSDFNLETAKFRELKREISQDITNMVENNVKPFSAYIDCLKDETVSFKKFDSGMTRTFSAGDLKTLLLFRMYFGDFVNSMTKNRFDNGSTIGINPYSGDWDILAKNLLSKNRLCNAGDYSAFDTSQSAQLISSMLDIIEDHYKDSTPEERKIRYIMWRDLTCSVHVSKGKIYKWDNGLPSGTYLTATINSIINRMYHKLCFRMLTGLRDRAFWIFNKAVCLYTHGDDSVFTVIPQYHDIFNEFTLGPVMSTFGMVYTPEDKGVREKVDRKLTDITFLKRRWRYEPLVARWVAPMLIAPLLDQLNWTRKTDGDLITIDKANSVSRELAMHPQCVFDKYIGLISKLLMEHYRTSLTCTHYLSALENVLNLTSDGYSESNMNFDNNNRQSDNDYPSVTDGDNILKVNEFTTFPAALQSGEGRPRDLVDMDDAAVTVEETPLVLNTDQYGDSYTNTSIPDIARFLGKPTVIEQGRFQGIDGPTTFSSHDWYEPLNSNLYAEKMKGIYTINATLVLTLQVNATPMQQGRYILAYIPMAGNSSTAKSIEWYRMHRPTITQILQLPHCELDLATQTEAVLKVPWTSVYNSYYYNPVGAWNTNPGAFFLYPYESLTVGPTGSQDAGYYLWAHYEDVKLGVVGSLQSNNDAVSNTKSIGDSDVLHEEQENKTTSKTLYAISRATDALAAIPVLSSFAGPLSYGIGAAARLADIMGFSKPNLVDPPVRNVRNNFPYMAAADGVDGAEPLSLTVGNHVSLDPCFYGTALDEMSIPFIASRPSYVGSYDISTSDISGTLIASLDVTPTLSSFSVTDGATTLQSYGPLAFLCRAFNLYKGSLVFDLKFIRTRFHSCRIVVGYQPLDSVLENVPGPSTLDKTDYMFRNIIDIREKTEASIVVPFICPAPWQETKAGGGYTGKLHFYVLDPVKAPDAVDNKITMKVEMRGGPDFAVASPRQMKFNPVVPATLQSNPKEDQYKLTCIGDSQVPQLHYKAEEAAIGEIVPSLRILGKRGGFIQKNALVVAASSHALLLPHINYYYKITGGVITGLPEVVSRDFYSAFSSMYAISRGGVRIRLVEIGQVNQTSNIIVNMDTVNSGAGAITQVITSVGGDYINVVKESGNLGTLMYANDTPVSGIVVPQYTRQLSKSNVSNFITDNANLNYQRLETSPVQVRLVDTESTNSVDILTHRALADDGGFGNFVSIPLHYED